MQAHPLASQQLPIDRLGQQRVAEHVPLAAELGSQQLLVDRLPQALQELLVVQVGDYRQQGLGGARAGRGGHAEDPLGAVAEPDHPGQQHLLEAGRQHLRIAAGQQQLFGKERVALRAGVDVLDQPGRRVGAQQAGQLLGHLGTGEARQLQPLDAAVAAQFAQQPTQRVRRCSSSLRKVPSSSTRPEREVAR